MEFWSGAARGGEFLVADRGAWFVCASGRLIREIRAGPLRFASENSIRQLQQAHIIYVYFAIRPCLCSLCPFPFKSSLLRPTFYSLLRPSMPPCFSYPANQSVNHPQTSDGEKHTAIFLSTSLTLRSSSAAIIAFLSRPNKLNLSQRSPSITPLTGT